VTTIAFIVAMRQEASPFLRRVGRYRRGFIEAFPLYRFTLSGCECVLIECGIGLERAAQATRVLCATFRPRLLVSFGVAGAPNSDLSVGDVVAVERTCRLDGGTPGPLIPLARWSGAALEAAARASAARGARLFPGTAVSTKGETNVRLPTGGLECPVLDMETAAVAEVAAEHAVPLLALRSISDTADDPLPFTIADALDERDRLRVGRIIAGIMRHPGRIPRLARLQRNMACATRNLTAAVCAAVEAEIADLPAAL
jgi:adenosylhomocysteine nucleosidase